MLTAFLNVEFVKSIENLLPKCTRQVLFNVEEFFFSQFFLEINSAISFREHDYKKKKEKMQHLYK